MRRVMLGFASVMSLVSTSFGWTAAAAATNVPERRNRPRPRPGRDGNASRAVSRSRRRNPNGCIIADDGLDGTIGPSFLQLFDIYFDYAHAKAYFIFNAG